MKNTTHRIRPLTFGFWALLAAAPLAGAQTPSTPPPAGSPQSNAETSYLFGLTFGEQMHSVGITDQVDTEALARGVRDALGGKKSTRADQQQIQAFVQSVMAETTAHNKAAAEAFLATNGKEKGVKTTADGLQYKVLAPGDSKAPAIQATDEVTVNYRGKLLDGTEFDSSFSRGVPATFKINGVIKGWQEALVLMKPGAKWQLFIPAALAYGDAPRPGIPAGSLLIFDVELISVAPSAAPSGAAPATPPPKSSLPPKPSGSTAQ